MLRIVVQKLSSPRFKIFFLIARDALDLFHSLAGVRNNAAG